MLNGNMHGNYEESEFCHRGVFKWKNQDSGTDRKKEADRISEIVGAQENNLKNIDVEFPLGVMTCVTGVSGSGKSSLINEILYKRLARDLNRARTIPGKHKRYTRVRAA